MTDNVLVTTLDILRHGECTDGDVFRGRTDSSLSQLGLEQMQQAAQINKSLWDTIISSPLQRCLQFSQSLSQKLQKPLITESNFQEMSFGDWDGLTTKQVETYDGEKLAAYWLDRENNTPPNGELLKEFHQRIQFALTSLLEKQRGQQLLLVTHGGVVRSLMAHCLQIPLKSMAHIDVPYGCRTQIKIYHSPNHPDWMQLMHHQPLER